ncbi:MAG: hypothetical protein V4649_11875 [Bacteroidota bacterium]
MNIGAMRQELHNCIDMMDEAKIQALYTLLGTERNYAYTQDEINMLNERAEKYLTGDAKTYTVEEAHALIRAQIKK